LQYHGGGAPRISAVILLIAEDISSIAKQNPEKKQTILSIGYQNMPLTNTFWKPLLVSDPRVGD